MNFRDRIRWVAPAVISLLLLLLHACATSPPQAKPETASPYTVRFPGAEPMEFETPPTSPVAQPELPPTDADEKKGRWLRVIEVERNPRPATPAPGENPPPPGD